MMNKFMVGAQGENLRIMRQPIGALTKEEALNLAAWLMVLSGASHSERLNAIEQVEQS
jgi:hypothetical protein